MEAIPRSRVVLMDTIERSEEAVAAHHRGAVGGSTQGVLVVGGAHAALAVIRGLGRQGIAVRFLGHDHPIARYSRYLAGHHHYSGPLSATAIDEVEALCDAEKLHGWLLMACADAEALLFAEHRDRLETRFRLLNPPAETMRLLNEKARLYPFGEKLGLPVPRPVSIGDPSIVFPVALKPSTRRHNNAFTLAKAWRADDMAELRRKHERATALAGNDGVIVQELIPGDGRAQFSYAALWDGEKPIVSLTARRLRQYPIEFGATSTFVEIVDNPEVEALAERLLAAAQYRGLVEVEFKYDKREGIYKLLDVNTRPWTWIGLGEMAGADFAMAAYKLAYGEPQAPRRATRPCAWVHALRDVVAATTQWRSGGGGPLSYLRSLAQPLTFAAMRFGDPLPGLMDIPILVPRLKSRRRKMRAADAGRDYEIKDDVSPVEWDRLAAQFADATFEQFGAFRGPIWGDRRLQRIAVLRNGRAVMLALATVFSLPAIGRGLAYVKFGPLWRRKGETPRAADEALAAQALADHFVRDRKLALTVLPYFDLAAGDMLPEALAAQGFKHAAVDDAERFVVDTSLPEDAQLASLAQKWRYNLKQALKGGLTVTCDDGAASVETFNALFAEMESRKNYKNDAWDSIFPSIRDGKLAVANVHTVLVRDPGGAPVAGAVVGYIGDVAYYLYGATGDRALKLKAGFALQWWIVDWLRRRGVKWYDLGGAAHEPGLRQFKEGLAGKAGRIAVIPGEYSLCESWASRFLARSVMRARGLKQALKRRRASP